MDDNLTKNLSPSQLTDRKDRIDYLVNLAKKLVNANKNYDEIVQELDAKVVTLWSLGSSTRKDYCESVIITLREVHKLILESKNYPKITSKKAAFDHIMYSEQEKANGPVKDKILFEKMTESGFFTMSEAQTYVDRMCRSGRIYEPKPGFYQIV